MTKEKVSQEADKRIQDLEFLSTTAIGFLDLPHEDDIYEFIAHQLKALVGKAIIIVASFDEATSCACARAVLGLGRNTAAVMRMLGKHPLGMVLEIDREARLGLGTGKLTKVPEGLYEFCFKRIPETVCRAIEKLLDLGDIYAMGFTWKGKLFSSASILTYRGSILQNQALIGAFIKQASVALQHWHAEEALQKARDELEARVDKRTRELMSVNERLRVEIAERKQIEEALRESEIKYRAIFETTEAVTAIIEKDMTISLVNKKCERMLGYSKEELEGKRKWTEFVVKDELERLKEYHRLRRVDPNAAPRNYECRLIGEEGNVKIALVTVATIPGTEKSLASALDITERKRVEEALRESEKRYRDLVDLLPQTVFELDERAKLTFVNRNAFGMFRYSQEDFDKGLSALQMFIPEDQDRAKENIKRRLRGEKFGTNEYTALRKDGSTFPVLLHSAPIVREGKPIGLRGIIIDITDRKQAEDELRRSQERLRNLSTHLERVREEERTEVAREIHDDLGQSLTALKMDLFFLRKRLPEAQESLIQKITEMITLIDTSISNVKRISSQLRPGLLDDLGLVPAIQWQVGDFEQRTGIKCKLATNAEDIAIDRDISTAFFRILQEALTNVARHANATKVNICLRRKADNLELKIIDNGKGITKKQIQDPKSFGLMGMRERIEYLGGEFKITGIRGKGTTLVSIVPLNQNGKAQ